MGKPTFISEIEECFCTDDQNDGQWAAQRGFLRYVVDTSTGFAGQLVVDNRPFNVELSIEEPSRPGNCSCRRHETEGLCHHIFAMAILLDDEYSVDAVPARASRESRTLKRLQKLRGKTQRQSATPWDLIEGDSSRLAFVIEASEAEGDAVVLHVKQRTRKANGDWSSGKHLDLAYVDYEAIPSATDRRLLGLLGYGPNRLGSEGRSWRLAREEHQLSAVQAAEMLPALAREGRLEFRDDRPSAIAGPIDPDAGDAYSIRLRGQLSAPDQPPVLTVGAVLERGDEEVPLSQIRGTLAGSLAVVGDQLIQVQPLAAFGVLRELVTEGPLAVGEDGLAEFQKLVSGLPPGVWGTEGAAAERAGAGEEASADGDAAARPGAPRPELHVSVDGRAATTGRLECEVLFRYADDLVARPDSRTVALKEERSGEVLARQLDVEVERLQEYVAAGGRRSKQHRDLGQDGNIPRKAFPDVVRSLHARGWRILADKKEVRAAGTTSVSVSSGMDWFEVEGALAFGDETVAFPELLKAAKAGARTVELGDGSTGVLPETWLQRWGLLEIGEVDGERLRFQRNQGWLLDALLAEREEAQIDAEFEAYSEKLRHFRRIRPRKEPAKFKGELRPYQREALGWFKFLGELGLGGCLADDMGLGKTVQVLALLESRRTRRLGKDEARLPSLVVAPKSLVFNWIQEAKRFAPHLKTLDYTGTGRQKRLEAAEGVDLVVTTFGSLRKDAPDLAERRFDYAILDEATAIKNPNSQSAKAARLIRSDHRLALTGTPVENNLHDLWSLFEFLNPGMLGRSAAFRAFAERPAPKDSTTGTATAPGSGETEIVEIGRAIRPFFLRRTKDEVLTELPEKSEQVLTVELSPKNRKRYDELRAQFRKELLGEDNQEPVDKLNVLTALLRLRQAACHPPPVYTSLHADESAKLSCLIPRLEELCAEGHKVLVFSQFTTLLGLVKDRLDGLEIPYEYLDGKTRKRQERVERFQSDPAVPLFLISLKAGGHGLNLTAADYVFLLDPWWNPAIESQAVDRAHRMGQTRSVFAYRLIARDTVEERVMELQATKRQLADDLFKGGKGVLKDLTRADLDALLS